MTIRARIVSGINDESFIGVDDPNALRVSPIPWPPLLKQLTIPFKQYLTSDGTSTGSRDMVVDGSTTPQDFYISARQTGDLYITSLSFMIADNGASLNKFGNVNALTNGVNIFYERPDGVVTLEDELKTNLDVIKFAQGQPAFGTGGDAFLAKNAIGANIDAYIPFVDLKEYIPPHGIKLDMGTTERFVLQVRDNLAGMDRFDVAAFGFIRLKDEV